MDINFETTTMIISIVLTGLTAGLCFTWTNVITPGIGQLDDLSFLLSFQQMNRAIINPIFLIIFFGPFISNSYVAFLKYQHQDASFWIFLAASLTFTIGVVFITILKNVPLNEVLDKTNLADASLEELKMLRKRFENPWKQWHFIRTISSTISFVLLLVGSLYYHQS
ncbi:DUF1772 domain-containing protein [uncultured Aquimarina sp.]|uniref:anthrone oxygenase family protein n=1 Tax=uncultured Aquimarina sp. TaxID=575652 RepID=UPI002626CFA6|nr:DUF1772 domain-containing protein [uncultured Aquimarina sp.]